MCSRPVHSSKSTAPRRVLRPRAWSLATRLTVWYVCSASILLLAATASLYRSLVNNLDQEEDLFLADTVQDLRQLLKEHPDDMATLTNEADENSHYIQVYVRIRTEDGRTLIETPGMAAIFPHGTFPPPIPADQEPGSGTDIVSRDGRLFRGLTAHVVTGPSGHEGRVIQVALSQSKKQGLLAKYRKRLWRVLGIALGACALVGYQIAQRGLRPVREISEAAQRVGSTTLDRRIATANLPAELLTMANIFNEMLARLQESFDRLSQFSANIAHELRTPVNNLRGMAEVVLGSARSSEDYRETLESCLEECVRLSRLIDSLLFLARAEQTEMPIQREALHVGEELKTVRDFYEAIGAEAGISLTVQAEPGLLFDLDRTLFQRAVGNLVSNALAYTPRGGMITLSASRRSRVLQVEVSDTGCGIPADQLPRVFDRFYRAHPASPPGARGMGLGLAIVKSIVTLHGGSAEIASTLGRGTCVTLVFPPPAAAAPSA